VELTITSALKELRRHKNWVHGVLLSWWTAILQRRPRDCREKADCDHRVLTSL